MENLKLDLVEAALLDIRELVKKYPNDMDLGKQVRNYFLNLPEMLEAQKKKIDEKI